MSELEEYVTAVRALRARQGRCRLDLDWQTVLCVLAALQLALSHPTMPEGPKIEVRTLIDQVIHRIHGLDPRLAEILKKGDDPQHDVR